MSDSDDRPSIPMELELRVDILDNEGIWNTGKIVDVSRDEEDMVEIKYDGWGDEYNEWIPLSSQRLAPLHMFTMVKKCWAKLTKWPWWPAFVVLRAPTHKSAADALNAESKIYVEFFDSYNESKRSRCWMQKKNIASFQEGFDERASKNIGKNFPAYVEGTQRAIAGGSPVLFSGNGTLPIEFSSRYAEPLSARKLALASGDEDKWFEAYRIFSNRYRVLYGYDFAKDSANTLLAAKHAKGKRSNGSAASAEDDDDDDDEVEIIESFSKATGRGASDPSAKRGRGRPPKGKHPKKQPPASDVEDGDDDEGEEKEAADDDYQDAGEEEEEDEDDGADKEPESPRGRRSTRTTKRKILQEEEPRRNTRPRRTKEDEGDFFDDDDDEGEDFATYEYHDDHEDEEDNASEQRRRGRSSSRSVSPEMRQPRAKFNTKAHKRSALTQLLSSTQSQSVLRDSRVPPQTPRRNEIPGLMKELQAAVRGSFAGQDHAMGVGRSETSPGSTNRSRRKPAHPQSSSERKLSIEASPGQQAAPSLHHWLGFGAADEGIPTGGASRKPWSIQSWLLSGFRRKQASESSTNDD